jgi:hypothetical protein
VRARTRRRCPARSAASATCSQRANSPTRVKTYHLDDDELAAIAERATARRADAWLASGATTNREAVG